MKTFNFNGYSSDEFGIYVSGKDIHSAPARSQEFISVPGRDGAVIIDNGNYENVNVSYTCYCKDLILSMNAVKAWLCRPGYCALQDDYNPSYFRYAAYSSNLKVDELINNVGKFTINFNCKPFMYLILGLLPRSYTSSGIIENPLFFDSLPKIKIIGTGACTLNINSRAYSFTQIPTSLEVDSELMSCFNGTTLHNDKIQFTEFPYLEPGENSISWTGNITKVVITPKWRTL